MLDDDTISAPPRAKPDDVVRSPRCMLAHRPPEARPTTPMPERDIDDNVDADSGALFVHDRELRRRINPRLGWDRFRAAVRDAENRGFPKVNRVWGGRFWPAVEAWLHIAYSGRRRLR